MIMASGDVPQRVTFRQTEKFPEKLLVWVTINPNWSLLSRSSVEASIQYVGKSINTLQQADGDQLDLLNCFGHPQHSRASWPWQGVCCSL